MILFSSLPRDYFRAPRHTPSPIGTGVPSLLYLSHRLPDLFPPVYPALEFWYNAGLHTLHFTGRLLYITELPRLIMSKAHHIFLLLNIEYH